MDEPAVVARDVLPQRVERQVAGGAFGRLLTLQVVHVAGQRTGRSDGARVHEDLPVHGPLHHPSDQPEHIAADRAQRTEIDHGPPPGRQRHLDDVAGPAVQRRDRHADGQSGDLEFHPQRQHPAMRRVAHQHRCCPWFADDEPVLRQVEVHRAGRPADRHDASGQQQEAERSGDPEPFPPAGGETHRQRDHGHQRRHPAAGGHRPPAGPGPRRRRRRHRFVERGIDRVGRRFRVPGQSGHQAELRGGGTSRSTAATTSAAVRPLNSASGSTEIRCASAGSASAFTSSGIT